MSQIGTPEEALEADIVVELAGGLDGPLTWARAALDRGTPYVTANKALLATHGGELAELAERRVAALLGERQRRRRDADDRDGDAPGHDRRDRPDARHRQCNHDLHPVGDGRGSSYDDALLEAQAAGYAEADPSFDVDGRDAAQKLAILASVAWARWRAGDRGRDHGHHRTPVPPGENVRLVAEATRDERSVAPRMLDPADPLAVVRDIESMLEITMRDGSTFRVTGPGAGGESPRAPSMPTSGAWWPGSARSCSVAR